MKIGLSGSPGVGKSEVASKLQEALINEEVSADGFHAWAVHDNAEWIEHTFDRAVGIVADYDTNLMMYFDRQLHLGGAEMNHIHVGTTVDNLVYATLMVEINYKGIRTPDTDAELMRLLGSAQIFQFFLADRWDYDLFYFIPAKEHVILLETALGEMGQMSFNKKVDLGIRTILDDGGMGHAVLSGTTQDMVDRIVSEVKEHDSAA